MKQLLDIFKYPVEHCAMQALLSERMKPLLQFRQFMEEQFKQLEYNRSHLVHNLVFLKDPFVNVTLVYKLIAFYPQLKMQLFSKREAVYAQIKHILSLKQIKQESEQDSQINYLVYMPNGHYFTH